MKSTYKWNGQCFLLGYPSLSLDLRFMAPRMGALLLVLWMTATSDQGQTCRAYNEAVMHEPKLQHHTDRPQTPGASS